MKFTKLLPVLAIVAVVCFASCKKSSTSDIQPIPNPISDSNYLDKIYELYDRGYGLDTEDVYTFHYDKLKRVVSINYLGLMPANSDHFETFYYSYSEMDTLPYKSVYVIAFGSSSIRTVTTYHIYDAQRRNLRDSIMSIDSSYGVIHLYNEIEEYSYSDSKVFGRNINIGFVNPVYETDTASIDLYGNILMSKKYYFDGHSFQLVNSSNFIYDNHLNPFAKLSNFKAHRIFSRRNETSLFEHLDFNNKMSQTENDIMNSASYTINYSYVYNTAGFPLIQNSNYVGGADIGRRIYKYKAL